MKKAKKQFKCGDCGRVFGSARGRIQHGTKVHPYVPPPQPKQETEIAPDEYYDNHRLLNGRRIQIGDVVWLGRKTVVMKITRTDGLNDVQAVLRVTKKWYSQTEIS
jgi:hypothetical protein